MSDRILVTAALPYANGSLHLGHLVEYTQADIYVRARRRLGDKVLYICATDAHGTPIELNAAKQGVSPDELVEHFHREHERDFARFDIVFDHFGVTHSPVNKAIVEAVYEKLRAKGHIVDRQVDGNWCEHDQRFLPDRYIKGECPKCHAVDQYGDVCEVCSHTYAPTDLQNPYCVICGKPPTVRKSEHVFFTLSAKEHVDFLRDWIDSGSLQPDVANYVRNWVDGGLRDWDISRDGPYFGFPIPDKHDKYFYVWLDAPFGYVSSSAEWGEMHGVPLDELWHSPGTRIEHVIGKDIVYFHTLFWPAVLRAAGYTLPSRVQVHGMLTVDGEKMSKTRGTFINAAVFADHVEPQALRFYYASKLSSSTDDLDLSFDDFVTRVNAELVNKHANLFSRAAQFCNKNLEGRLGDLPFTARQAQGDAPGDDSLLDQACQVVAACRRMEEHYRNFEFSQALRELAMVADMGNEYMQAQQPWVQIKSDVELARQTCTFVLNVCHALATYLWPVVPRFAEAGARLLGSDISRMDANDLFAERNRPLGSFERLFERIDKSNIDALVEASRASFPQAGEATSPNENSSLNEDSSPLDPITIDDFARLDLRVGVILSARRVPKSKRLLQLMVDIGDREPRQILSGIAQSYDPESIVGRRVVLVANLKPVKLMGVESRGMLLAATTSQAQSVLLCDKEMPPGTKVS